MTERRAPRRVKRPDVLKLADEFDRQAKQHRDMAASGPEPASDRAMLNAVADAWAEAAQKLRDLANQTEA